MPESVLSDVLDEQADGGIAVLASDLDGTLLPIDDSPEYARAMDELKDLLDQHRVRVLFVTGRSFDHVLRGMAEHQPPIPEAIICDVGTTIMTRHGDTFERDEHYHAMLSGRLGYWNGDRLRDSVASLKLPIRPQESRHQSELKCSFYYQAERRVEIAERITDWITAWDIPVSMTISVDPFDGHGMMDLLPAGADKGSALEYWITHHGVDPAAVVFAGDTGNDVSAAKAAAGVILPENADQQLRSALAHRPETAVYRARGRCTAGVLEGVRYWMDRSNGSSVSV